MIVLPRGSTGFFDRGEGPPASVDVREFRRHCYAAAAHAGCQVVSVGYRYSGGTCGNFVSGVFEMAGEQIAALLNVHHPLIAFGDPPSDHDMALRFRDCAPLAAAFESLGGYQLVSAAELELPPTPAALAELSEIERHQVASWKPRRIGDVAFNWWD